MKRIDALPKSAACLILVVASVSAGNQAKAKEADGQSIFEAQYSCAAKGTESSLRAEDLTVLDFTIGSSTMRDVQKRFPGTHSVKLAREEEAQEGICIKNEQGMAAVFATGVMGPPDTLVAIYLAPARLVESSRLVCKSVDLPSKVFSSKSGIRIGTPSVQVAKIVRGQLPAEGPFCVSFQILSSKGPLQTSKRAAKKGDVFTDFTGVQGVTRNGKLEWVEMFGIASD